MPPFTLLSRDQILAARDRRKTAIVKVPEWFDNGAVIVVELSGTDRDAFEADMVGLSTNGKQQLNLRNIRAKLAARSIADPQDFELIPIPSAVEVDDQGIITSDQAQDSYRAVLKKDHIVRRLFSDQDMIALGELSASALQRIFDVAQALSGITNKDVEELTGELKNAQSGNSGIN